MDAANAIGEPSTTAKEREILDRAAVHFLRHGYGGTSINSLSREARISKESVYRYFRSKQELFEAVIAGELDAYRRGLTFVDSSAAKADLQQALQDAGETILASVCSDRVLALRRLIFQQAATDPKIGRHYYEIGPERAYDYLERLFALHAGKTRFAPDRLARHYVGLLLHSTVLQRECGVLGTLNSAQIRQIVTDQTTDFLTTFFDTISKETRK
jgi:AcrR family transcriptional regulator